jgi:hypothetical protein
MRRQGVGVGTDDAPVAPEQSVAAVLGAFKQMRGHIVVQRYLGAPFPSQGPLGLVLVAAESSGDRRQSQRRHSRRKHPRHSGPRQGNRRMTRRADRRADHGCPFWAKGEPPQDPSQRSYAQVR